MLHAACVQLVFITRTLTAQLQPVINSGSACFATTEVLHPGDTQILVVTVPRAHRDRPVQARMPRNVVSMGVRFYVAHVIPTLPIVSRMMNDGDW